ncbi:hypothetical protein DPMN_030222 [Dreissena polymorpha]|uniref:Uncharacterized protein n=1 Tax=Dreissena polymorpha TaxID=45954 RepID=A0A9D4LXS9_DREPO|nr:hypothetical protein DPMN_030222 [Dreissena polymorpha]
MIANAINKGGQVAVHGSKIVNCDKYGHNNPISDKNSVNHFDTFGHNNPNSASSNANQVPYYQHNSKQDQQGRGQISEVVGKVIEVVDKVSEDVGKVTEAHRGVKVLVTMNESVNRSLSGLKRQWVEFV